MNGAEHRRHRRGIRPLRKFAAKTQHDYVQTVMDFAVLLGRSPASVSKEDIRRFQLHSVERRIS
jgi:hypothetical protein